MVVCVFSVSSRFSSRFGRSICDGDESFLLFLCGRDEDDVEELDELWRDDLVFLILSFSTTFGAATSGLTTFGAATSGMTTESTGLSLMLEPRCAVVLPWAIAASPLPAAIASKTSPADCDFTKNRVTHGNSEDAASF